ncbi:hypothetical protein COOONC_23013 [Cooperia oncophora]
MGLMYMVLILLALGIVVLGIFCATVFTSIIRALTFALLLWLVLVYLGVKSPPIYESIWLVLINQFNIVAAFKNILESVEYLDLRGTPLGFSTLFTYGDILGPGISLIFIILDIIIYTGLIILYDSIEWAAFITNLYASIRKKKLEQLKSQSERHSWHQDEEVRQYSPDIDAEDVSKVWETSGELAVYRFEIRAYTGEVSVLLGHSGSGKTTAIKMVCGDIMPTQGRIRVCEQSILRKKSFCRSRIGYCPQANMLYNSLTVMEHMWFFYSLKRALNKSQRANQSKHGKQRPTYLVVVSKWKTLKRK